MATLEHSAPSPTLKTSFTIQSQNISGDARVHNGNSYNTNYNTFLMRRASTFESRRPGILKWLSPLNVEIDHDRVQDKSRVSEQSQASSDGQYAGKWLLESDTFDDWASRKIRKLWYFGMPGAGKTVLASVIISRLLELRRNLKRSPDSPVVAYLYLSYKEPRTIEQLLGSIIKQIVQDEEPLPPPLLKLWTRRDQGDASATVKDLSDLLHELSKDRQIYIVIDALDECPSSYRSRLVEELKRQRDNLSILFTSRLLDEFKFISEGFEKKEIKANSSDVDLYIDHEFGTKPRLKQYLEDDPTLLYEVKTAVRNACDGMFLLASLQMQVLASALTLSGLREETRSLPNSIDEMYQHTLDRIKKIEPGKAKLAFDTLAWIVSSCRPLRIEELQHALAIKPGNLIFDFDQIYREDDLRDFCGGLVTIVNGVVSLIHITAQNFFDVRSDTLFPGFHSEISQRCIAYLSLPALEQPDDEDNQMSYAEYDDNLEDYNPTKLLQLYQSHRPLPRPLTLIEKRSIFPFADYAGPFLGYHLREIAHEAETEDILKPLTNLLQTRSKRNFLLRIMWAHDMPSAYYPQSIMPYSPESEDGSDLASDHGSDTRRMDPYDSDAEDSEREIDWIIQDVLDGTDSDSEVRSSSSSSSPESPTETSSPAVENNTPDLDPEYESDDQDESSILDASSAPLFRGAARSFREITPIHLAAFLGWVPIVTVLLGIPETAEQINAIDQWNRTPLIMAVVEGHWDIVLILLDHNATLDLMSVEGPYVLLHAAQNKRGDVVQNLITHARGPPLQPPVHRWDYVIFLEVIITATSNILIIIMLFVEQVSAMGKLKANSQDQQLVAPNKGPLRNTESQASEDMKDSLQLLEAAMTGDADTIKQLVHEGKIDLTARNSVFHILALFLAVELSQPISVQALLEEGANVNMRGFGGDTPLHRAASRNHVDIVKILLGAKANVDLRNDDWQTPWSCSLDMEHREVLDVLRRAGADPNVKGMHGVTKLYSAAAGGDIKMVRFLLESGVDPSIKTRFDWAPLHWAANNGHLECVRVLIDAGADVNAMSDVSTTPLDMARKTNQTVIADILIHAGAKTAREILGKVTGPERYDESDEGDDGDDEPESDSESEPDYSKQELEDLKQIQAFLRRAHSRQDLSSKDRTRLKRAAVDWLEELEDDITTEEAKKFCEEIKEQLGIVPENREVRNEDTPVIEMRRESPGS
ncbi:ankyrin repeat-containing domain protein [Hypoxylon trugodes]|uniref:ankyrin repeat-containing domain protein n=1 Tax=Hypoxylon trugodes TaxID=326681 RepID=UPI0021A19881|nr:ankyrin repeat-containing domain protein [Hypoxylon trugodes]KAI1388288.1 ankyrin repeat-containing domain protein [Hypoxylon trugodes]